MLFNRLILLPLLGVYLLVSACGFQPLYAKRANSSGDATTTDQLLASVSVATIQDREGQILHNLLLDRLNPGNHQIEKKYTLTSAIKIYKEGLGTKLDDTTSRSKLTITATFRLTSATKNREFSLTSVSGYSETQSEYPTLIAEQDAIERNLRVIANDAKLRISLYLEQDR